MKSVGAAAFDMIEEVRRQFKEIPGIMEGQGRPLYGQCVAISTKAAFARNDCSGGTDYGYSAGGRLSCLVFRLLPVSSRVHW